MQILIEQLDNHHTALIELMEKNFVNFSSDANCDLNINIDNIDNNANNATDLPYVDELQKGTQHKPMYSYNSQFWDVPKQFIFQQEK